MSEALASRGDEVYVRVKDIASGQEAHVALGSWDTIGVLKKRLEGKGLGAFDQQVTPKTIEHMHLHEYIGSAPSMRRSRASETRTDMTDNLAPIASVLLRFLPKSDHAEDE